jgi:CBS domain-containing protein
MDSSRPDSTSGSSVGESLTSTLTDFLRQLDQRPPLLVESANTEFLAAMIALERRLEDLSAGGHRRREEGLADLINVAPLSHGEKELLHDLRQVRNAVVHNVDVHVGTSFTQSALQRLQQIAERLDAGSLTAGSLMTREVRSVAPEQPLAQVQTLLLRRHISQVAVIARGGVLVGWVTHRSLLRALSRPGANADPESLTASAALAETGVVAVELHTNLERMVSLLEDPDVQSLAVMDDEHLRGIVTRADLLRVVL